MRNCPVCKSQSKDQIKKIEFELFDGHPMQGGYDLVQCKDCGFVYADTSVTQNELDDYYTNLSKYEDKQIGTGGGFTKQDKERLAGVAKYLAENITDKSKRILDLGCANGGLLKELKLLGYTNLVGIDPSNECLKITKSEVGCECFQYSIFDIDRSVGKFDVIILSHVIEHILELQETVYKIDGLLNDGGFLYVECPNAQHYKDVIHAPYQEFNTEHINHFTEIAFRNLFGIHQYEAIFTGNKVLQIASGQDYHAVFGIFRKKDDIGYTIKFDSMIIESINEYIHKSDIILLQIVNKIKGLAPLIPVALFGIGQFSFKLLKISTFSDGRSLRLFDNNSLNVGKRLLDIQIFSGKNIVNEYEKEQFIIIISSLIHENSISAEIKSRFMEKQMAQPYIIGFSEFLS